MIWNEVEEVKIFHINLCKQRETYFFNYTNFEEKMLILVLRFFKLYMYIYFLLNNLKISALKNKLKSI